LLDFGRIASPVPKGWSVTVGDASAAVLAIVSKSTTSARGRLESEFFYLWN
jgi:hypothetical protein